MIVHEKGNPHDENAMAGMKTLPGTLTPIIGHVPKEISRFTRYIADHGATISAFVVSSNYRRSPLIQGGREIPIKLVVKLLVGEENYSNLEKYSQLATQNYKEPVNGEYEDAQRGY